MLRASYKCLCLQNLNFMTSDLRWCVKKHGGNFSEVASVQSDAMSTGSCDFKKWSTFNYTVSLNETRTVIHCEARGSYECGMGPNNKQFVVTTNRGRYYALIQILHIMPKTTWPYYALIQILHIMPKTTWPYYALIQILHIVMPKTTWPYYALIQILHIMPKTTHNHTQPHTSYMYVHNILRIQPNTHITPKPIKYRI